MLPMIHEYDHDTTNKHGISYEDARRIWEHLASLHKMETGTYPEPETGEASEVVQQNFREWFENDGCTPALLWRLAQKEVERTDEAAMAACGTGRPVFGVYTVTDVLTSWAYSAAENGQEDALADLPALTMCEYLVSETTQSLWDRVDSYNQTRGSAKLRRQRRQYLSQSA